VAPFTNPSVRAKVAAADYIGSLMQVLGDRDPLAVLAELEPALDALLAGLDDVQLHHPEGLGKWSMVEVVQHLADSELVYAYRIRMTVAMRTPQIQGFDQDLWASELGYAQASMQDARAQLRGLRAINLRLLRSLTDEQLERQGLHTERGPESVRTILKLLAGHDLVHRAQIQRIRAGMMA
jgi:uncharacterized damage-inducible protein DinB